MAQLRLGQASSVVRGRSGLAALAALLLAAACKGSPALTITPASEVVDAAVGRVEFSVEVAGGRAADVQLAATYGKIVNRSNQGRRITATLTGLNDASVGRVEIQAKLDDVLARRTVVLTTGAIAGLKLEAVSPYIDADRGTAALVLTLVDAAGNPVDAPDLVVTSSAGRVQKTLRRSDGSFDVAVTDIHDVDLNPIVVQATAGGFSAVTELTVLAGAPARYDIVVETLEPTATEPFQLEITSRDTWGNRRASFGEIAYLRAYRLSQPELEVPISPRATNLFVGGTVTMAVSLHGFGSDVLIEVRSQPEGVTGIVSRTPPLNVRSPEVGCVVVEPTGLDSRVQTADALSVAGGFPLQVVVTAQSCASIVQDGADFQKRIYGFTPRVYAHLANGTFWGSSQATESPEELVGPTYFVPNEVAYRFHVTDLTQVGYSPVRITAEVDGHVGQLNLEISPGAWRTVTYETIPDQFEGTQVEFAGLVTLTTGFAVSIFATDKFGNNLPTATGSLECRLVDADSPSQSGGTLTPTETLPFTLGVLNQFFGISLNGSGSNEVMLDCQVPGASPPISGRSDPFTVRPQPNPALEGYATDFIVVLPGQTLPPGFPGVVTGFAAGEPLPQQAGVPFDITIVARSAADLLSGVVGIPLIKLPVFTGNQMLAAGLGGIETMAGDAPREDSPLTADFDCQNKWETFPGVEVCTPPDNTQYYRVTQRVRLTTATPLQTIVVNPPVPSIPPALRANTSLFSGASTTFVLNPGPTAGIVLVNDAPDSITAGTPFTLTLNSVDEFGNATTDYSGTIAIEDLSGSVWPKTAQIEDGTVDIELTVYQPWANNVIRLSVPADGYRVETQAFNVE